MHLAGIVSDKLSKHNQSKVRDVFLEKESSKLQVSIIFLSVHLIPILPNPLLHRRNRNHRKMTVRNWPVALEALYNESDHKSSDYDNFESP